MMMGDLEREVYLSAIAQLRSERDAYEKIVRDRKTRVELEIERDQLRAQVQRLRLERDQLRAEAERLQ